MSSFDERAKARQAWPVRRYALGEEPPVDERDASSPTERMSEVMRLTRQQWLLAGKPWPTYARADMPGVIIRRGGRP